MIRQTSAWNVCRIIFGGKRMNKHIHYRTLKKVLEEKLGIEIDQKELVNNTTGEIYNILFEEGTDVAIFTKRNGDAFSKELVCLDTNGDEIAKDKIVAYINGGESRYVDDELVISEKEITMLCNEKTFDVEELLQRETALYPERTSIMLRGMFSKNGFSSDVTNFYVDEIIYVDEEEFTKIRRTENVDTFKAYNEKTYEPVADGVHGVLVIGPNGDGIMVDTQGYDYARYMSYAPNIEMPINYMLEQRMREEATLEMKLYVPLKVEELDREMGDTNEIDGEPYLREIRKKVYDFNLEDGERGLARYFGKDNISRNKVYSIKPDVEMVRDTMMGVAVIKMTKPLTQTEIDDLKDYVTGQFSDGWGESFEQREIQVSGGEIYVHFWDSEEYYINTDEEMEQMLEQNLNEGIQGMQGMSGM